MDDSPELIDSAALRLMLQAYESLANAYEDMADKEELFNGPHMYWYDKIEDIMDKLLYLQVKGNRRLY